MAYSALQELIMTRLNVLPPHLLFDEWVSAHCREGLRPLNKVQQGKIKSGPVYGQYRLGRGHELHMASHLVFVYEQWHKYKQEWVNRGGTGFDWTPTLGGIPKNRNFDYKITKKDLRHNLARLCDRFRKRKKPYHFDGEPIDNYKDFKVWLGLVKEELEL